ncbi:hypothetical protein PVAND_015871 [Polypedilum vanderplanki]|uniref:Uncharacterized protein n=1 Tax=Polypedilum vanderplanki TaxID=319348 RepID=A0A9J6BDW7_POLVA|nr:hypothetical protein PVAND_015871 [Polypedilum vanderplanki]
MKCEAFNWKIRDKNFKISMSEEHNIKILSVENQTINFLPHNLKIFHKLEELNFKNNEMKEIGQKKFAGLEKLKTLKIIQNNLTEISSDNFVDLKNLENLNLRNNKIAKIHPNAFLTLENLKILQLDENKLTEIDEKIFIGNRKLQKVTMSTNFIKELSILTFQKLPNLLEVRFHANELQALSGKIFETNRNLRKIDFSNNKLEVIESDIFQNLYKLTEVDFEWNLCVNYSKSMNHSVLENIFKECCQPNMHFKYKWLLETNKILKDENEGFKKILGIISSKNEENETKIEETKEEDENSEDIVSEINIEYPEGFEKNETKTYEDSKVTERNVIIEQTSKTTETSKTPTDPKENFSNCDMDEFQKNCIKSFEAEYDEVEEVKEIEEPNSDAPTIANLEETTTMKTSENEICNSEVPLCNDDQTCVAVGEDDFKCVKKLP